ncbi:hypothetical protein [Kitasatospora griseola]|uniref:hypothetical protein n=1 Tax=Kitasatospora griseola TaxID=2064 RepID=UPI00364977B7
MSTTPETSHRTAVEAALHHHQQLEQDDTIRRQQLDHQAATLVQADEQPEATTPELPAMPSLDNEIDL